MVLACFLFPVHQGCIPSLWHSLIMLLFACEEVGNFQDRLLKGVKKLLGEGDKDEGKQRFKKGNAPTKNIPEKGFCCHCLMPTTNLRC